MVKISIREIIESLQNTTTRDTPYKMSQMAAAVTEAAQLQDKKSLEKLSDALVDACIRLYPERPRETMIRIARDNFATLAYLADHETKSEWVILGGPAEAYKSPQLCGPAMNLVKIIYAEKQIDLIDIFKDNSPESQLN